MEIQLKNTSLRLVKRLRKIASLNPFGIAYFAVGLFLLRSKISFHYLTFRIISPSVYFLLQGKIYFYCISLQFISLYLFPTKYFNKVYFTQTLEGIG